MTNTDEVLHGFYRCRQRAVFQTLHPIVWIPLSLCGNFLRAGKRQDERDTLAAVIASLNESFEQLHIQT